MSVFLNPHMDMGHKMRSEKNLEKQIRRDYEEVKALWEGVKKGTSDISETEKILERIAWVNSASEELKTLMDGNIEGVYWVELNRIEKDVKSIQRQIRIKTEDQQTENSHPP